MKPSLGILLLVFILGACQPSPSLFAAYRGEWLWVATFAGDSPFVGRLSISERFFSPRGFIEAGTGAWVWCEANGRCPYLPGDRGRLALWSGAADGVRRMAVEFAHDGGFGKLIALDLSGMIASEDDEDIILSGPGRWYYYSGGSSEIGFAMARLSFEPATLLQPGESGPSAAFARAAELAGLGLEENELVRQARAHLESLLEAP
jgi:hypothetical protein